LARQVSEQNATRAGASAARWVVQVRQYRDAGSGARPELCDKTALLLSHVRAADVFTPNTDPCGAPIIELPIACSDDLPRVAQLLWEQEIYVTLAEYPLVPRDQVGFRIQVTAANTYAEIDHLMNVLNILSKMSLLRPATGAL
jgi:8-amino-7-oxononanoate synthase